MDFPECSRIENIGGANHDYQFIPFAENIFEMLVLADDIIFFRQIAFIVVFHFKFL